MMNILILSAGRRVKVVQYFVNQQKEYTGKVYATDMDENAPALHFADEYFIVPGISASNYIDVIVKICIDNKIGALISLIDPELELIAESKRVFEEIGVLLILSPLEMIKMTFDKVETAKYLKGQNIRTVPTYIDKKDLIERLNSNLISLPLVAKPRKGSASIGITLIEKQEQLEIINNDKHDIIFQPFFKEKEFGVDVYIDMINGHLVDLFIKEKIKMRSGETDKSISIHNTRIEKLVTEAIEKTNFKGPIDIDIFEFNGEYYISEINPRFGGGYPHAYECGVNFMEYIFYNLLGEVNSNYTGFSYEPEKVMMKYDDILIR